MSLKSGNEFFRRGYYDKAIEEYKKILKSSPLYYTSCFNIEHTSRLLKENATSAPIPTAPDFFANEPLVSIVMPVFNVGIYLDASILSVLSQSYHNFELIIINDASTDNSRDIINMYAKIDKRIKAIHLNYNTLGGAGIPSNIGMRAAQGQYLAFVDSDDIISQDSLKSFVMTAEQNNADLVIGTFCTFDDDDRNVSIAYDQNIWDTLPYNKVISVKDYPELLRMSPVPWRKLYKREFLLKYSIYYPEGDYFYEDNPLHWFVLSEANSVVLVNKIINYHRMGRDGQTMNASAYKLSAMCCHLNTIGNFIYHNDFINKQSIINEFYDYCYRCYWVATKQCYAAPKAIIEKRFSNIHAKFKSKITPTQLRDNFKKRFENFGRSYPDTDLTVVIPAYNCYDFIVETISSVFAMSRISFNVLLIDDGSDDGTVDRCKDLLDKYKNFHIFQQNNKGAGRARNALIPMCTGRYTYFLDADDFVEATGLEEAVLSATAGAHDLYFFRYKIDYYEKKQIRGMFKADEKVWEKFKKTSSNSSKQFIAAALINYPWNRIIKTDLLHDENIFFAPTIVHNDIAYHWHSIVAANNIGYCETEVCTHRKFAARPQITNIGDHRRMMVFEALRYTHGVLSRYASFSDIRSLWAGFTKELLKWAESKIPAELQNQFRQEKQRFFDKALAETKQISTCCAGPD